MIERSIIEFVLKKIGAEDTVRQVVYYYLESGNLVKRLVEVSYWISLLENTEPPKIIFTTGAEFSGDRQFMFSVFNRLFGIRTFSMQHGIFSIRQIPIAHGSGSHRDLYLPEVMAWGEYFSNLYSLTGYLGHIHVVGNPFLEEVLSAEFRVKERNDGEYILIISQDNYTDSYIEKAMKLREAGYEVLYKKHPREEYLKIPQGDFKVIEKEMLIDTIRRFPIKVGVTYNSTGMFELLRLGIPVIVMDQEYCDELNLESIKGIICSRDPLSVLSEWDKKYANINVEVGTGYVWHTDWRVAIRKILKEVLL